MTHGLVGNSCNLMDISRRFQLHELRMYELREGRPCGRGVRRVPA